MECANLTVPARNLYACLTLEGPRVGTMKSVENVGAIGLPL